MAARQDHVPFCYADFKREFDPSTEPIILRSALTSEVMAEIPAGAYCVVRSGIVSGEFFDVRALRFYAARVLTAAGYLRDLHRGFVKRTPRDGLSTFPEGVLPWRVCLMAPDPHVPPTVATTSPRPAKRTKIGWSPISGDSAATQVQPPHSTAAGPAGGRDPSALHDGETLEASSLMANEVGVQEQEEAEEAELSLSVFLKSYGDKATEARFRTRKDIEDFLNSEEQGEYIVHLEREVKDESITPVI